MPEAAPAVAPRELVLDRYRPLRPLGSGGSGSVWLARDEQTGLDVALKIVARDGKAGHRAEREAQVASRLRHEPCLRAYACGSHSRHVYVAYEDAPGTLAYIPPERLAGVASAPAGGVCAVGVVLWEAIAAMHPFWTSSPVET